MTEPNDIPKIYPEGCKLLIQVDDMEKVTTGGIILPESAVRNEQRRLTTATVLRIGPTAVVEISDDKQFRPGTHINAIGADAKGKQELESDLVASAKVVVDDIEQASHSGEINVPLSQGRIKVENIYGILGEVIANMKKGRENDKEITIFDSTGLAIQDIACAKLVYEKAIKRKTNTFELF